MTGPTPGMESRIASAAGQARIAGDRRAMAARGGRSGAAVARSCRPICRGRNADLRGAALVEERGALGERGVAAAHELLQHLEASGAGGDGLGLQAFAHQREHARVDRVGLGAGAEGLGEQARAQRIDDGDRDSRRREVALRLAMIACRSPP